LNNYLCLDIENTNSGKYGREAGNFLYDKIVAVGYKNATINKSVYSSDINLILGLVPSSIRLVVGHNIKHDLLFLWKSERLQYMLKEGLEIYDTQLVEYMLSGQQNKYPALRETAVNYGCTERPKLMEPYWENGFDTDQIPKELVLEDVQNDVMDTEQIYIQQVQKVKELGLDQLVKDHMDALLATIEMEFNGIMTSKEILQKNKKALSEELEKDKKECEELVRRYFK
jgi:DNA polymerase I-like protein with 3'-5' exonuclease and polymerase domains